MTPKCTGSMPKALTTGRKIGVQMMIIGAMSMKVPSTSRMTLISSRMMIGLSEIAPMAATVICGTCRKAISQPKAPAVPMTSSTIAVVRTACMRRLDEARARSARDRRRG